MEVIIQKWLSRTPRKYATPKAQHIRKVVDKKRDLIEIVKYGSKIFTEPNRKKSDSKISAYIYVSALDNILSAMDGLRIFDRFGFNLPTELRPKPVRKTRVLFDFEKWVYYPKATDWLNNETGKLLSGYILGGELARILKNNLEVRIE